MATLSQTVNPGGAETIMDPPRKGDGIVQTTNSKEAMKIEVVSNHRVGGSNPPAGALVPSSNG
jgi:hypothetical protein